MTNQEQLEIPKVSTCISLDSNQTLQIDSGHQSMNSLNPQYDDTGGKKRSLGNGWSHNSTLLTDPSSSQFDELLDPSATHSPPRIRRQSRPCPESSSLNCVPEPHPTSKRSSEPLGSSSSSGVATLSNSQDLGSDNSMDDRPDRSLQPDEPERGPLREIDEPVAGPSTEIDEPVAGPSREIDEPVAGPSREVEEPVAGPSRKIDEPPKINFLDHNEQPTSASFIQKDVTIPARVAVAHQVFDDINPSPRPEAPMINLYDLANDENMELDKEFLEWYCRPIKNDVYELPMYFVTPSRPILPLTRAVSGGCKNAFISLANPFRKIVSQRRRRFVKYGFNLDLTYITDRVIAMGYPADDVEALYRNAMNSTKRFLAKFHKDKFWIFNLRGRYSYDPGHFGRCVTSFEMEDHHPPRLEFMAPFCRQTQLWLEQDPRHVIAVHCKAGKGRTGVMICAYLVHINFFPNPRQVLDYYSIVRTINNQGVTIPSQRRYIYYYEHLRRKKLNYLPLRCELVGIFLEGIPEHKDPYYIKVRVTNGDVVVFESLIIEIKREHIETQKKHEVLTLKYPYHPLTRVQPEKQLISHMAFGWTTGADGSSVFLEGDIQVELIYSNAEDFAKQRALNSSPSKKKKTDLYHDFVKKPPTFGHVWFNTMFTCPGYCEGHFEQSDESRVPLRPSAFKQVNYIRRAQKNDQHCLQNDDRAKRHNEEELKYIRDDFREGCQAIRMDGVPKHDFPVEDLHHLQFVDTEAKKPVFSEVIDQKLLATCVKPANGQDALYNSAVNGIYEDAESHNLIEPTEEGYQQHLYRNKVLYKVKEEDGQLDLVPRRIKEILPDDQRELKISKSQDELQTMAHNIPRVRVAVNEPPRLEEHCPRVTLPLLYPRRPPPREEISDMMRVAFHNGLVEKFYEPRTLAPPPKTEQQIPRSTKQARGTEGPINLYAQVGEHYQTFGRYEIDGAHKTANPEITDKLRLFVVTKCITSGKDMAKAQDFVKLTRKRQERIDFIAETKRKLNQIDLKMRQCKEICKSHTGVVKKVEGREVKHAFKTNLTDTIIRLPLEEDLTVEQVLATEHVPMFREIFLKKMLDLKAETQKELDDLEALEATKSINIRLHPTLNGGKDLPGDRWDKPSDLFNFQTTKVVAAKDMRNEDEAMTAKFNKNPKMDPRYESKYYRKFFYRQRQNSPTRYPNFHHHCPMDQMDRQICAYYRCPLEELEFPIDEHGNLIRAEPEFVGNQEDQEKENVTPFQPFQFDGVNRLDPIPQPDLSLLNEKELKKYFPPYNERPIPAETQPEESVLVENLPAEAQPIQTSSACEESQSEPADPPKKWFWRRKKKEEQSQEHPRTSWTPMMSLEEEKQLQSIVDVIKDDRTRVEELTLLRNKGVKETGSGNVTPVTLTPETSQASGKEPRDFQADIERRRQLPFNEKKFEANIGKTPTEPCERLCQCLCREKKCSLDCFCHDLYQIQKRQFDYEKEEERDVVMPIKRQAAPQLRKYIP
ncbi:unnamed protein product [Bursaphelenchus xylophilus]|uniref:phosphatidylinositol-3,4,5-trisphosphate 3-phosphatase n=1 Tax=Bursaphelenchus xylophilus TaxID=6326 RepID=A0A1I7SEZ1_BURXY|nr:unnamed protein product [Bursaphelenchus xylophilus]CAG9113683.1 unnamed protein product [Bursaphelenchus xylophilus]